MKRNIVIVAIAVVVCCLMVSISHAAEKELTFSWTVQPVVVEAQKISELRVYQDTWVQAPESTDPLLGTITFTAELSDEIGVCSLFWATHANTGGEESAGTEKIKVCKDADRVDPDPATPTEVTTPDGILLVVPPGYTATIEANEVN